MARRLPPEQKKKKKNEIHFSLSNVFMKDGRTAPGLLLMQRKKSCVILFSPASQVNCCCFNYSTRLALLLLLLDRVMNIHAQNRDPDKRFILSVQQPTEK